MTLSLLPTKMCRASKNAMHRPAMLLVCTAILIGLVVGAAFYDVAPLPSAIGAVVVAGVAVYVAVDMRRAHKKKTKSGPRFRQGGEWDIFGANGCPEPLISATHKNGTKICLPPEAKGKLGLKRQFWRTHKQ